MARFDVYPGNLGYLLDVQTDLLFGLNTRLVVPLFPTKNAPVPAGRLNPVFEVNGHRYAMQPQLMASVPARTLSRPVDNLRRYYDEIVAAIDMIFLGF
jgi:toxin CcdB